MKPSSTDITGKLVVPLVLISIPAWKWLDLSSPKFPFKIIGIFKGEAKSGFAAFETIVTKRNTKDKKK